MYNTITQQNDYDWRKGLAAAKKAEAAFHSAPSIINNITLAESTSQAAYEALADEQMYNGAGVRRYDGTWSTPEEALDDDIFGDDMMRISYANGEFDAKKYDLKNSLGWLADRDENLKNYIDAVHSENPDSKQVLAYYDAIDGKVKDILKSIGSVSNTDAEDVQGRFVLAYDEEGTPYWQEVLTTKETRKLLESAGISLVNSYGALKYSDGALTQGIRSFTKGLADFVPNVMYLGAAVEDLGEAVVNGVSGDGWKADYDTLNQAADDVQKWLDESMVGRTSYSANMGTFDNWEGFAAGLGQGAASLVQYAVGARAVGAVGKLAGRGIRGAAGWFANKPQLGKFADGAAKVQSVLSSKGLTDNSLGAIGHKLNQVLFETPEVIPMVASGVTLNFGEAYKAALDAGIPLEDAAVVGFATGIANTFVEMKVGPNTMLKYLAGQKGAAKTAEAIVNEVGGDISKLGSKAISNKVLNNVVGTISQMAKSAVEEGGEEIMQAYVKNAVENFYDSWIAPHRGGVEFGTKLFGKQEFVEAMEEGFIGSILGSVGGFANSRQKENNSIIPYVAAGKIDELKAAAALAKQKGALTEELYNGVVERAEKLDELRTKNRRLFEEAALLSKEDQIDDADKKLKALRDQQDYIEKSKERSQQDSTSDTLEKDSDEFDGLIKQAISVSQSLAGVLAFSLQLQEAGRRLEAKKINEIVQESVEKSEQLLGKESKKEDIHKKLARHFMQGAYAKNLFLIRYAQMSNDKALQILHARQSEQMTNPHLSDMFELWDNNSKKFIKELDKLTAEYENTTDESKHVSIRNKIKKLIDSHVKNLSTIKEIKTKPGSASWLKTQAAIISHLAERKLLAQDYIRDTSDDYVILARKGVESVGELIKTTMELRKANNERAAVQEEQKEKDEKAVDESEEEFYSNYKNQLQAETDNASELSEERKKYIDDVINGDELTQVNALEAERTSLTKILNNLSREERTSQRGDLLREESKKLNKIINYLRKKYDIKKTEADKNKRYKTTLSEDTSVYTDESGNKYTVNRPATLYSENEGLVLQITPQTEATVETVGTEEGAEALNEQYKGKLTELNYQNKKAEEAHKKNKTDEEKKRRGNIERLKEELSASLPDGYRVELLNTIDGRFEILVDTTKIKTVEPQSQEYTEAKDSEFLNSLVDEDGVPLSTKMRQDKRTIALQVRTKNPDLTFNFETVSEEEAKGENSTKTIVDKINAFADKLKCIIVGDAFKKQIADPRNDASLFEGVAEVYIWDSASKKVKEAKELFDKLRSQNKKWEDLTKEQQDLLIDYLPLQLKLKHPYLKNKEGKMYENIVSIPARKSDTSKTYEMQDDQVEQRQKLIAQLLNNGKYAIKKGDVQIQPGLFNIVTDSGPEVLLPDGTTVRPGAQSAGDLRKVKSLNIVEEDGKYYVTLPLGDKTKKMPLTIGIAGQTGVINYTYVDDNNNIVTRAATGVGSPGTPYLIIPSFLNLNKKDEFYPLKLNPRRIDRNTATTVAKLMYAVAKGTASKEVTLNTPIYKLPNVLELFGIITEDKDVTVGDVLNDIIYWGQKTLQNDPDPALNKEYLKNKLLYIDFKSGVVKYGNNETVLGEGEEELNKFINWIINNKSFSIDRAKLNAHEKMQFTYEIANGYSSEQGADYITTLLNNEIVRTNLSQDGPLYRGQFIRLNSIGSSAKSNPVEKPKPEKKELVKKQVSPKKEDSKGSIHSFSEDGKQKNAKAMKEAMQSQNGTITFGKDTKIVNSKNEKLGDISEFTFTVEDGKINGIEIDYTKSLMAQINKVVELIVMKKYKAASLQLFDDFTFTPQVESENDEEILEENEEKVVANPRVGEVYKKAIDAINKKFSDKKPTKVDISNLLSSLVNASNGIAKLYGFTDYKEARALLGELAENGKTLEQNLTEYMQTMGENSQENTDDLAAIAATVFSGRKRKGTVNSLVTDQDMKQGWKEMTEFEKRQLKKIVGKRHIEWVNGFVKVLDYIGNPAKAFGAVSKTVIEIMNGAKEGTGYHEAFHNTSLFALDQEERLKMYEDARNTWKSLKDKNDKEVEEFLADKFMEYSLEMQLRGVVDANEYKGIFGSFKKMWEWVKTMFGFKPKYQDINTLFKKIYSGNYSKVRTNKDALVYFDNTYGKNAKVPLTINGKTLTMDSEVFSKIINNLTAQLLYDNDITNLESVRRGINIDEFKNKLQNVLKLYSDIVNNPDAHSFEKVEGAVALVNLYTEILDNWTSVFKPFVESKLANYGIRRRAEDAVLTIDEDLKNLINDELVSSWEINSKHNAKAEVRMLFLALQKTKDPDPITKLPQYENPDVVWYNVISKLHSATTFDEMMERLEQLSKETNQLRDDKADINPYSELRDILLESGNENLKTQFFVTMKKHKNKFINYVYTEDGNGLEMRTGDADINKRSKKINIAWSKAFAQTNPLTKEGKERCKQMLKNYQEILENTKNENISFDENVRSIIELLSGLSVIVDEATIRNILSLKYSNYSGNKALSEFLLSNNFSNIFANKGKTVINKIINDKVDTKKIDNILTNENLIKTLAESYVQVNPSSEDDSVIGPEGNAVYSYSENNSITQIFEEFLKDELFLAEIGGDVYSQGSLWLKQLKDPAVRRAVGVKTVLAVMNKDDYSTSRGYLDVSDKEDIIIKLRSVMEGNLPIPTLANKKSYYVIHGLAKQQVRLSFEQNKSYQLNNAVIQLFKNYAIDELNAIKLAYEQRDAFVKALGVTIAEFNAMDSEQQRELINSKISDDTVRLVYSDLVENYHYSLSGEKVVREDGTIFYDSKMILDGNGYKFRYYRELEDMLLSKGLQHVEKHINTEDFENEVRVMLNARVNETIETFIKLGIINVDSAITAQQEKALHQGEYVAVESILEKRVYNYIPVGKEGKMFTDKASIATIIADYAINTAISTIEFEKVVSGDLAFYKSRDFSAALDDRVKRYSALTSTRQAMNFDVKTNDDYEVDFDTRHYKTATLATNTSYSKEMYDIMYDKYVGTVEEPGLLYKRFIDFAERNVRGYSEKSREDLFEMAQEDAKKRLSGYLKTDPTDAQVWISPKMFRKLAILNGEWSKAKEEAFKLLESDKVLTEEEELKANLLVMQPLKYVHYGFVYNSKGLKIPVYDKMSLATVFRRNVAGTKLKAMYDFMLNKDVDMVKMETAVKAGNRPKQTYYNKNGEINDLNNSLIFEQDFKYLGKQLVTDPHEIERTTLLTQFIKIAVSNVDKDSTYELDGNEVTGQQLLDQYNNAIENLSKRGVERIKNKFGFKDGKVDKRKLIKMLNEAANQSKAPQNLIDALLYSDQDLDYYIELSTLPSLNWIHSRIISLISKETIDITTPGNAFYQTTSFGYDNTGSYRKLVGDNTLKKYSDKLRFKNENGRLEVKLSINLFRGMIPSKYKTFEQQRKYILTNKELFAFAYRVPTQGMNSTLPIEIVDVLPTNSGDVILLPLEVTALTGSDFDIDKMYLASYNYYDDNGIMKKVQFIDRNDYDSQEEFLEAIWESRYGHVSDPVYIKEREKVLGVVDYVAKQVGKNGSLSTEDKISLIDLAKDYSKYISLKQIYNLLESRVDDFDGVKNIRGYVLKQMPQKKDIVPKQKFINNNLSRSMWDLNKEEAVENRLLDIFGTTLTSDNHYIDATTPLDVTTKPLFEIADKMRKYFEEGGEIKSLAPLFPTYQEDIKSKNTGADAGIGPMALINVFRTFLQIADISINPVVGENNIMQKLGIDTLNKIYDNDGLSILDWTSALINAHVDAAKDPYIIRLNVNQYTYNVTAFMISAGFGESTFYFLPQPILKDLAENYMRIKNSDIGIDPYDKYTKKYLAEIIDKYESQISKKSPNRVNEDEVIRNLRNSEWLEKQIAVPVDERDDTWYATQLTILDQFIKIQEYADGMRDAINAMQIDTKKYGINSAELMQFRHLVEKVENSKYFVNPKDLFDKTFIGAKYKNTIQLMFDMLSGEIMDFSQGFVQILEEVEKMTRTYYLNDERTVNAISNEIKSALYGQFINSILEGRQISVKDLFYGKESVVTRVQELQKKIAEGQYRELKDNAFLKLLLPNVYNNDKDPMTFENSTTKQRDVDSKNAYTFAWMDLLEHEDEYIRNIGHDLILYSFYMGGGLSNGVYNFYDLVPYGYLANLEYNGTTFLKYIKQLMTSLNEYVSINDILTTDMLDVIFKSSWKNDKMVLPVKAKTRNADKKLTIQSDKNGNPEYVRLTSKHSRMMYGDDGHVRPYIKIVDNKDINNTKVFKLVGYFNTTDGVEFVYGRTNKLGYDFKGFRIKESLSKSQLPHNTVENDFSEDLQLGETIKKGDEFTALNPFEIVEKLYQEDNYNSEGEPEIKGAEESSSQNDADNSENNPSEYTNYSGAASGADTVWAEIGREFGIGTQRDFTPEDLDNPKLTSENRQEIENAYQLAVRDLGRHALAPNTYRGKLVRRDYLQAKSADAIYAVGTISNGNVNGGTGYAVAMAKRMNKPIHVFDQTKNSWFTWDGLNFIQEETPTLTKNFAGIGTREINEAGKQAIRDVYENTFGQQQTLQSDNSNILQQHMNDQETNVNWSRYADNGYEVSSQGDKRFSALTATFKEGTVIEGVDVGGKTIEWVYQNIIKKSGKGKAPSKDSKLYNPSLTTKLQQEDYSYSEGYLPLWKEWARQNPELIDELRELSKGKTLTDKFASTRVSQARALAEILNNTKKQRPSEKC